MRRVRAIISGLGLSAAGALAGLGPCAYAQNDDSVMAPAQTAPEDRVGVYETPGGEQKFIFDRSGNEPKLKFFGSNEVFVLRADPAPMGDRLYKTDSGRLMLRMTTWGGLTLFTPDNEQGLPASRSGDAKPLALADRGIAELKDEARALENALSLTLGKPVAVYVDWEGVPDDSSARATLFDSLTNARAALGEIAGTEGGAQRLAQSLNSIQFRFAAEPGARFESGAWTVEVAPAKGLEGRMSSAAMAEFLNTKL